MTNRDDLALLLGRVEGKVDTLVHLSTQTSQRVEALETRVGKLEQAAAAVRAAKTSGKEWLTNLMAVAALCVSAVTAYWSN
ncbi:hypothetical protein UFOVP347_39 [uncultured Caudovirales phage]|uniref:Uncharacterized protein n=1 Tax=uncultured Caudovirales phage TaxID=2100421 RepID=A0A6J5M2H7_9CAUD|nr:hypothetical protein UFOVP347_39 [uncultured Caudovirales phage]